MAAVNEFLSKIERTFSVERFGSYRLQGGSEFEAVCKYLWNIALCESLYPVLSLIEVSYRNALHSAVIRSPIGKDWLSNEAKFLSPMELGKIEEAKESLRKRGKSITEAFLIAELSFGFWNSLLDSRYEILWRKIIADVFPHMPRTIRTRGELSSRMSKIRNLRNSALHHHSIWHWSNLNDQHAEIYTILGWICDSSIAIAARIDRFPQIQRGGFAAYNRIAEDISK